LAQNRCISCMNVIDSPVCPYCGYPVHNQTQPHQLPVGTMLRGRYQVGRVLGQGGFGITYIAWDTLMENVVAVKEFFPGSTVNRNTAYSPTVQCNTTNMGAHYEASKERFLREAKALVRFRNVPEVVDILDFMEENNTAYIVMEFVRGVDLAKYIQGRGGRLSVEETFRILKPVMEALATVHKGGIVHRDISPDNIILDPMGGAKLLDFGAVRSVDNPDVDKALNKSTEAILKQGFAPLEQYNTRGSLGPWTDEYAMCATVFYCLTGRIPEDASIRVTEGIDPDWDSIEGLPEHQKRALEKGMSVRAKDRYPDMDALMADLFAAPAAQPTPEPVSPVAPQAPVFDPTVAIGTPPVQPQPPVQPSGEPIIVDRRPKKKLWPILATVAAVLVVAILAGILLPGMIAGGSHDSTIRENDHEEAASDREELSADEPAPAQTYLVTPGKLTVAVSPDFWPMEFVDPIRSGQDQFVGLDMSFARFLASELELELVLMPMSFNGCQQAVFDGRVDMSISGFSWTANRSENYTLSKAYGLATEPNVLITLSTDADQIRTPADLRNAIIAVQEGSLQESMCLEQIPNAKLVYMQSLEHGIALLKTGQITAVADNLAHAEVVVQENPTLGIAYFEFEDVPGNVILLRKGNTDLAEKVNGLIDIAFERDLFNIWREEINAIDGFDVSYNDDGTPIS